LIRFQQNHSIIPTTENKPIFMEYKKENIDININRSPLGSKKENNSIISILTCLNDIKYK
jgi:hypothetical protein